jgi:hypothetical protein
LPGPTLQLSGSAYQLSRVQFRSLVRTTLPWTSIDQSLTASDWSAVPTVAAYGYRLSPRLGVAFGVWIPVSSSLSFVSNVQSAGPLPGSGVQIDYTQQIAITQRIESSYFGAAAGLALRPGLRVGVAAFAVYDRVEQFVEVFAGALTTSTQSGATASASIRGTPSLLAARLGLGVQWDVAPTWTIAAALKTPTLALRTLGGFTNVMQSAALLPGAPPSIEFTQGSAPVTGTAAPWRVALGTAVGAGRTSVRVELDWQAPRGGLAGVANGRVGLLRAETPDLSWGAGIFTDRSPELVRTGSISVDYYGVAAGVDYRPPPVRSARPPGATWDVRTSLSVRYAAGWGEVQRLQANPFGATSTPSSSDVVAHALALSLGALLLF